MEKNIQELFDTLLVKIEEYQKDSHKELLKKAFLFAYDAHKNHTRKSGEPYIVHPLSAAIHLTRIQADENTIIACLLHDVMDNPEIQVEIIQKQFGSDITKLVSGVYNLGKIYYRVDMTPVEVEILKQNLITAGNDIRIFLIKISERLHNLQTLQFLPQGKRYRIAKESEEIYLPILNFLSIGEFMSEFNELCFQYIDEKQYKKLNKIYGKSKEKYEKIIIDAYKKIDIELQKTKITYSIQSRIKSLHSIYKKINDRQMTPETIYDFLALRVICENKDACYSVLGNVHKLFKLKEDKFKDYISMPKENGYQAIHTTVYDKDGNMLEFQILTKDMYRLNQTGLAAHFMYKGFGLEFQDLPEWMKGILDIQKQTLDTKSFLERLKSEVLITQIKCYDEKGNYFLLPKKSVLLDFAFEKNIKNGTHFGSALVNGKVVTDPFYGLASGDRIKLEMSIDAKMKYSPSSLSLLQTPKAIEGLIKICKKYHKSTLVDWGKFILNQALDEQSGKEFGLLPEKNQKFILNKFSAFDHDQLYYFIATKKIDVQQVLTDIKNVLDISDFTHEVSFKIVVKTGDIFTTQHIINVVYHLSITLKKITYNHKRGILYLDLYVGSSDNYDELLKELKRTPNVAEVIRIFPMKLQIYCSILSGFFIGILGMIFWMEQHILSFSEVLLSSGVLLGALAVMRQITQGVFHYFYRLKRGLYFIFLINSLAFLAVFFEFISLKLYDTSIVGFSFLTFIVFFLLFYNIFSTYSLYYRKK